MMDAVVTLVSGGMDSTLLSALIKDEGCKQYPLFIDYGQRAKDLELAACIRNLEKLGIPAPKVMRLSNFGASVRSGLTNDTLDIVDEVFLPNRNLLFLLAASSYGVQHGASTVAIGLLNEKTHLFNDQTKSFLEKAEALLSLSLGQTTKILAPLMCFDKAMVIKLLEDRSITETYSCHAGGTEACGACVACIEIINSTKKEA